MQLLFRQTKLDVSVALAKIVAVEVTGLSSLTPERAGLATMIACDGSHNNGASRRLLAQEQRQKGT